MQHVPVQLLVAALLSTSFAFAAPPGKSENPAAGAGNRIQGWQSGLPFFNLPGDDAKAWSRRNLAKISRLGPERLALAQRAASVEELDLALLEAPIAEGANLGALLNSRPGGIQMIQGGSLAKAGAPPQPPSWSNLVFTSVPACRILDTRPAAGGSGPWTAGSSNVVKIGPYATGYQTGAGAQGGSPSSCQLDWVAGPGQIAVIVAAVSTVSQAGPGYLTFYKSGAARPQAVSQFYQPGSVQTSFVLIPTDLTGQVSALGYTSNTTEVIVDVVGFFSAGDFKVIDTSNTASGREALNKMMFTSTGGFSNTANGYRALYSNDGGVNNTAVGFQAALSVTSGSANIAIGSRALPNTTSGISNIAIGVDSLSVNTTGSGNIAVGEFAGQNVSGGGNISIGLWAGRGLTTGNYNIAIGNLGDGADTGTIRIGAGQHARAFISGIRGVTTGANDAIPVLIDSQGQLGTASSSRRFKEDVGDMDAASSALMKLRPVTFHYKTDQGASGRRLQYGLIAEEVAEVYPGLVARSRNGEIETVMYQFLPSMLLNEYQKQQRTIEAQTTHIARLERDRHLQSAALATQAAEIAGLKAVVARIEQQTVHLARLLDQRRGGAVTTAMDLK